MATVGKVSGVSKSQITKVKEQFRSQVKEAMGANHHLTVLLPVVVAEVDTVTLRMALVEMVAQAS